ncbi:hypothetical protein [Protofrankia symbiont of Coriaria ruscifolia]|uniref:hypothetical protein n=1 Tax=Protofrankia symbiont of Coriaria ruscifolia TaxID=1306542 RepID=UPI001F5EF933|nr:hypothetical protein [Protofrankia symbiont of Coriaria ruscifolia]
MGEESEGRGRAVVAGRPLDESERAELVHLRGEVKDANSTINELQMQVEFAKKVATWFAKGKQ